MIRSCNCDKFDLRRAVLPFVDSLPKVQGIHAVVMINVCVCVRGRGWGGGGYVYAGVCIST